MVAVDLVTKLSVRLGEQVAIAAQIEGRRELRRLLKEAMQIASLIALGKKPSSPVRIATEVQRRIAF